jgi:enamine deaminase RidA (YjgF/YER057c/UK114 family)
MGVSQMQKEILLEDERGRGFAAVVRGGPYLFVAGSDGHRDLATEQVVPALAGQAEAQCRNSYGRVRRRLEQCGYGGERAVQIQNYTSGQEWRLARMGLWPEYFGATEHGLAVSFGAQAKMSGLNMITTVVLALAPEVERVAVVPQPEPGRAARVVRAGPFVYVIGVRGYGRNPLTGEQPPEETAESFGAQLRCCYDGLRAHLHKAGADVQDFVRVDACLRDVNRVGNYQAFCRDYCGGAVPFASHVVGVPLGARGEQEIGGIAAAPGVPREVAWLDERHERTQAVRAGGLIFVSGCLGACDAADTRWLPELAGDKAGQTRQALRRLEAGLSRFDAGLESVLRLDVFLRDIYFEDEFARLARDVFGPEAPAITFVGAELPSYGEVELSAIAADPTGA